MFFLCFDLNKINDYGAGSSRPDQSAMNPRYTNYYCAGSTYVNICRKLGVQCTQG